MIGHLPCVPVGSDSQMCLEFGLNAVWWQFNAHLNSEFPRAIWSPVRGFCAFCYEGQTVTSRKRNTSTHPCLKSAKRKTFRSHLAYFRHEAGPSPVLSHESFKYPQGTRMWVLSSSEIASQERRVPLSPEVSNSPASEGKLSFHTYSEILDHI